MEDLVNTLLHYRAKENDAKEEYKRLAKQVLRLEASLRDVCTHPEHVQIKKSSYFGGSYYDVSYTEYWVECGYCKTKHSERTDKGYYG